MQDKRQSGPRVSAAIEATVQHAGTEVFSSILNLSSGGVFIITDNPMPIDAPLSMRFHLPGDTEIIAVRGRVVWIKQKSSNFPAGIGVQFTEISPAHLEKIQAFVQNHLRS